MQDQKRARGRCYIGFDELSLVSTVASARDCLILLILFETGCALQELVLLRVRDLKGSFLTLGKTRKRRTTTISPALRRRIHEYVKITGVIPQSFLFSTRESPTITTRRVEQLLTALGRRSIGKPITPRMLRATAIINEFLAGTPVAEIETKIGLTSIRHHIYNYFSQTSRTRWSR